MLLIILSVGVAIAAFVAFVTLCLGIRREDRAPTLNQPAPGFAARQARRFTGLRPQHPAGRRARQGRSGSYAVDRVGADA